MAVHNFTTTSTGNDATYIAENQLCDAAMLISCAMRLTNKTDGEAYCLLEKAMAEIIAAQEYLEGMDSTESPIDASVVDMLKRVGSKH